MARYAKFFSVGGGGGTNNLQLPVGTILDATLRQVQDGLGTGSPLYVSINSVQVQSTLKITTNSDPYIDAEDGLGNNRFTVGRDTSSQQVNIDFASNPGGSTTDVGAIRTYANGVNLSEVVKFREDGQVTFVERVNVEADSLVTTQISSVIAASTTNANLVIAPNGTGALVASIPDGTATGGNARGANAVDLQIFRTAATQVASRANSVIVGGAENSITAEIQGAIVGGQSNTVSNRRGFVGGGFGNNNGSWHGVITGGQSNTASTGTHATVVGGESNVSSGAHSISGGLLNTASGENSTALGRSNIVSGTNGSFAAGQQNNVSGAFSAAFGSANGVSGDRNFAAGISNVVSGNNNAAFGFNNTVGGTLASFAVGNANESSSFGFVSGSKGVTIGYASRVLSNNAFNTLASSQIREMIASRQAELISGATTTLSLDGTGVTNLISTLYDVNRMFHVTLKYVAVVINITGTATGVTIGDIKTQTIELGVKRIVTISSIVGVGNFSTPQEDTSMSTATLIPSIIGNNLILTFTAPTFAGGGSITVRVVSKVELVEVAY